MSERPMHQPGNFEKLRAIYADAEALIAGGAYDAAIAKLSEGLAIDDHFRQRYVTMYAQRGFAQHHKGAFAAAIADYEKALALEAELTHGRLRGLIDACRAGRGPGDEPLIE